MGSPQRRRRGEIKISRQIKKKGGNENPRKQTKILCFFVEFLFCSRRYPAPSAVKGRVKSKAVNACVPDYIFSIPPLVITVVNGCSKKHPVSRRRFNGKLLLLFKYRV